MRRASSVTRRARPRTAIVGLFAAFVSIALLACGVALADTVTTNFEAPLFHVCTPPAPVFAPMCTVNGQDGWKAGLPGEIGPALPIGYDQQVVANSGAPPEFGGQSLRISNAYTEPTNNFFAQTYSKPTTDPAGENQPNTEYIAQFSFISTHPDAQQPDLFMSVSPDNGSGGRMSYIGLEDTPGGIAVSFYDTPGLRGAFVEYDLGTLTRDQPHTITFWMKLNPGPDNDLVRIYIDGKDVGRCFTTWENYYRSNSQAVPTSDTLEFRTSGDGVTIPNLIGGGYLFDNVTIKTADGAGPPGCDVPIDKLADAPTVSAGGLAGYRITVRNRGRLSARDLLVCDHIPGQTTFVSADRKLRRLGRRRCLLIPRLGPGQRDSVHLTLRVNANAQPGILDNTADIGPVEPPGLPPAPLVPPGASVPDVPGPVVQATAIKAIVVKKVKAIVKVVARRRAVPPPVTG